MKFFFILMLLPVLMQAQTVMVNTDSLMQHVYVLASDSLEGRLPGTPGYEKALRYSMNYLLQADVQPIRRAFWPQQVPMDVNQIDSAQVSLETGRDMLQLVPGVDYSVRGYSGSGDVTADVVFCGYGMDSTLYSDYKGIDVKGKIVLVLKSNPPFLKGLPQYSIRRTVDVAYRNGAKAVIFVAQPNQEHPQKPIGSVMHGEGPMHADMPQIQLTVEKAEYLMSKSGKSLSQWQSLIDSTQQPHSILAGKKASVFVKATYQPEGNTQNVAGVLYGNDPILKDEYIIVSAHLDHVGTIGHSVIYPGANDDASGSAAVLELARVFSAQQKQLKRSVVFVLFGSEEKGLVGADYFANNLPVAKEKIVAVLNMDCIGYGDSLMVGNGKSCPDLWDKAIGIGRSKKMTLSERTWAGGGADLTPLHNKGIPGLYFVTTNSYDHLHLPTDTPETLNQPLFTDMVRLVYELTRQLAVD